jgi:type IV pilus assembly protein PilC
MKTKSTDIADFYRQIALLLKSGLPLPESIEQLGRNFSKPDFRKILLTVAEKTSEGKTLADTMKEYPDYFNKIHIQIIEAGEKSGMLPETLSEIARTSHMNIQLTSMLRDIALYPIFAIWFSFVVVFTLCVNIMPKFVAIFDDMLEGEPLPWLTDQILSIGMFFIEYKTFFITILILYPLFFLWMLSGSIIAKRFFLKAIFLFPGAKSIADNLNMARLCSMWSVLMKQKTPADKAIKITREVIEDKRVSSALKRVAKSIEKGTSIVDAFTAERVISGMVPLTIQHVPEPELPVELMNLAHLFRERASISTRKFSAVWGIALVITLAVTVGTVVIAMFLPLISIIKILGGG